MRTRHGYWQLSVYSVCRSCPGRLFPHSPTCVRTVPRLQALFAQSVAHVNFHCPTARMAPTDEQSHPQPGIQTVPISDSAVETRQPRSRHRPRRRRLAYVNPPCDMPATHGRQRSAKASPSDYESVGRSLSRTTDRSTTPPRRRVVRPDADTAAPPSAKSGPSSPSTLECLLPQSR